MDMNDLFRKVNQTISNLNLDGLLDEAFGANTNNLRNNESAENITEKSQWSAADLRSIFRQLALTEHRIVTPPDSIRIDPIKSALDRLLEQRKPNQEFGRMVFIRHEDSRFEIGKTCSGDAGKLIIEAHLPNHEALDNIKRTAAAILRTAAYSPSCDPGEAIHFTERDMINFFRTNSLNMTVSAAPGVTLILLKTSRTPSASQSLESKISGRYQYGLSQMNYNPAKRNMQITSQLAKELGLALYIINNSDHPMEGRLVKWGE